MDKEFAIRFLRVWVFAVVFLIIIIHVLSLFGLFVFHGIREKAFVCFYLVSVKLWNKTILLWLWLHVFARLSKDGLLHLNWNVGVFWCFLGVLWLSGLLGSGDWQRSLKVNKDGGMLGVFCYGTWLAHLLYIVLVQKYLRRKNMGTGSMVFSQESKTLTNNSAENIRYVLGSVGIRKLLNKMMVCRLKVFGIILSPMIGQTLTLWFERLMQFFIYITISSRKGKVVGTYGIVYTYFWNFFWYMGNTGFHYL